MANLGTLWFGADIDLTKLKQTIQQGNKDVLDALKMDYDQQSYNQMVSKLRTHLANETFHIKLDASPQQLIDNVRKITTGQRMNFEFSGITELNNQILAQTEYVNKLTAMVQRLRAEYNETGSNLKKTQMNERIKELASEKEALNNLIALRKAYRDSVSDSIMAKKGEAAAEKELNGERSKSMEFLRQIRYVVGGLLAVDQIRRVLGNVIEIGGQFEKQRVSMGAILGDVAKANVLFEQIKQLAVRSPFGVVELDQYTKQLAAYGFDYEEQFDMIKRLADIAAGAGQDISRLTLALGHVKSQTWLTGYTLRQFAMNNIPMLKMLSEYYTELEGTMVSTSEVQKRISERKVSYEDVIEQIRRMTDEGGMFYNMQEKIAETLAAKWKNLRDQIHIMFGEMAEGNVGSALKATAEGLTNMAKHWQSFINILTPSIAALGAYKLALIAVDLWTRRAAVAQNALNFAMKANPIGLIAAGLASVATYIALVYEKTIDAEGAERLFNEEMEEAISKLNNEKLAAERLASSMSSTGKSMTIRNAAYDKLIEMYPGILSDMSRENALLLDKAELLERINNAEKQKEIEAATIAYEKAKKEREEVEEAYLQRGRLVGMGAYARIIPVTDQELINAQAKEDAAKKYLDTLLSIKKTQDDIAATDWNKEAKELSKGFSELAPEDGMDFLKYVDKVGSRMKKLETDINNFDPKSKAAQDILPGLEAEYEIAKKIYYGPLGQKRNLRDSKSSDEALDAARTRLDDIKTFLQEYKKYRDVYGPDKAIGLLDNLFPEKGVDAKRITENYKDVLMEIYNSLPMNTDARKRFGNSILKLIADTDLDSAKYTVEAILNNLDREIKTQGEKWDLYKKILDVTGNKEQAAQLAFSGNVSFNNFAEQLRSEISSALENLPMAKNISIDDLLGMNDNQLANIGIVENGIDGIYKKLKQLYDEEQKLKSENIELFLNALKGSLNLEKELDQVHVKYENIRNAIKSNGGDKELLDNADRNEQIDKAKVQWEWFKKESEGWGEMFANIDRMSNMAIDNMIKSLEDLLPKIQANEQVVKELYEALEKLRGAKINRNPFIGLGKTIKGLSSDNPSERASAMVDFNERLKGISDKFNSLQDVIQPVIDLFEVLGETTLGDIFKMGSNAISSGLGVASGLSQMSNLFSKNEGLSKFFSSAGPWGAAIGAGVGLIGSIFAMHDASLQREIEASEARQKEMENLTKNLERVLERTLGGIYDMKADDDMLKSLDEYLTNYAKARNGGDTAQDWLNQIKYSYISDATVKAIRIAKQSKSYYDATYASLLAERDEAQRQLQLESDKKNADEKKIADYKQSLVELKDEIRYFATDMMKDLYDIDFKSWAQGLAETLTDAWAKGEDAAEAYRDKVSDILRDLGVKMIAERFVSQKLNPIMDQFINQYEKDKGVLTDDGIRILAGMYDAADVLSKQTTDFLDGLEKVAVERGLDLKGTGSSSSGLSKSIEGVTENTASLLGGYVNSIRADVSVIAASIPMQNAIAQTEVQHLESIERHTAAIEQHTSKMEEYLINQGDIYRYVRGIADGTYKVRV